MNTSIFRKANPRRATSASRFLPSLEAMEERVVMSHAMVAVAPAVQVAPAAAARSTVSLPISVTGLTVNQILTDATGALSGVAGTLTGTLAGLPFTTPITLAATPPPDGSPAGTCPVLDLHINAIHLNLLGLHVDTSDICLSLTATDGPGNLLGNLVCDVAHLLDGTTLPSVGGLLSDINGLLGQTGTLTSLGGTASRVTSITGLLGAELSSALGHLNVAGVGTAAATAATPSVTNILNLSVGPVDLNLLGLNVHLDNCADGPVTVDITAVSGPGNLLGNLLGGLVHLLDNSNPSVAAINSALHTLIKGIRKLV